MFYNINMEKIKISLISALLLIIFPANALASNIFSDNFDDCTLGCTVGGIAPNSANWMQWMVDNISATHDTVTHYSGEITSPGRGGVGKSLKLWRHSTSFTGSASYSGPLVMESPGSYNNFYIRFYAKIPAELDMYGGVGLKMFRFNTTGGEIYLNILPDSYEDEWYRGNSTLSIEGGTGWKTILDVAQLLSVWDGNWHCWQFNFNLAGDSVTMWIDGVQISSVSDTGMSGGWNSYMQHFPLGNQQADYWQDSWQVFEVDDLVIATTKEETDPLSGDEIAPDAPIGLSVL